MKNFSYVLAALAVIVFAMPSMASANRMMHHHHHHHHMHHHGKM